MSSLSIRPSLPLPVIVLRSTSFSTAILRTAGVANTFLLSGCCISETVLLNEVVTLSDKGIPD